MPLELTELVDLIAKMNRLAHTATEPRSTRAFFRAKDELINLLESQNAELIVRTLKPGQLFVSVPKANRGWHIPVSRSSERLLRRLHDENS